MKDYSLIVRRSLGSGRFVVTGNCRIAVPIGATLTAISSKREEFVDGTFVVDATGRSLGVCLTIRSVQFWRHPQTCVPYGHHTGVKLEGGDLEVLETYLSEHPSPWHVFLGSDSVAQQFTQAGPARRTNRSIPSQASHAVAELMGLGPKSSFALRKIGITSAEQLRTSDPFEVYARLKAHVPGTSLNFLYGLIAAIEDRHWLEIKRLRRTEILLRLEDMGLAPK